MINKKGIQVLLPHKLPKKFHDIFENVSGELFANQEKPESRVEDNHFDLMVLAVLLIDAYQRRLDTIDTGMGEEVMNEKLTGYAVWLSLERLKKTKRINVSKPNIENIFSPDEKIRIQLPDFLPESQTVH